jgi:hypothetical protein
MLLEGEAVPYLCFGLDAFACALSGVKEMDPGLQVFPLRGLRGMPDKNR